MERAKMYPWEEPYVAAILEADNNKLLERIQLASARILARLKELDTDHSEALEEREALRLAIQGLDSLRKERLGDPSSGV